MNDSSQTHRIQVIDRFALLLDLISGYENGVTLKILAVDADLHPSTAFRILAAMSDHGFVDRDSDGRYRLGQRLSELGALASKHIGIREQARDVLEKLRDAVGETVNLLVREDNEVVYAERASVNRMMRVEQIVGSRALLHVTAVGKLMLGEMGERAVERYARRTHLPAFTRNTITSVDALKDEVRKAHEMGYAYDNEEAELRVGCVGVLVRYQNSRDQVGISISAPIDQRRDEWIPLLRSAAEELSDRLGYK
ncbi:MAG: IclR family transcriptional regulator [Pseudomonadota bacterium]